MRTNLLILMGEGRQQYQQPKKYPPCLMEYDGKLLLQYIFDNITHIDDFNINYVVHDELVTDFNIGNMITSLSPDYNMMILPHNTKGSGCTALYGACQIDANLPLLIVSSNEILKINYHHIIDEFYDSQADAGILTFDSMHPRYSYARIDDNDNIIEIAQQNPISQYATTGIFWYRKTSDFVDNAKLHILKGATTLKRYYIAPIMNQMILKGQKIGYIAINKDNYIPFKLDQL